MRWSPSCRQPGIAAGVVQDIEDLIERDPQLAARGALVDARPSAARPVRSHRTPISFSRDAVAPYRAPRMGEHDREIALRRSRRSTGRAVSTQLRSAGSVRVSDAAGVREAARTSPARRRRRPSRRPSARNCGERVVERGEPFAIAQADTPHEIFHAMDIPVISNQWWSAYISAKQLSSRYFDVMDELGYPANSCKYCSLGLACTLANDPATAPWGGLPKPTVLVARLTCDCIQHVFTQWAEALGTDFFAMEAPAWQTSTAGLVPRIRNERLGRGLPARPHRPAGRRDARPDRAARAQDRPPLRSPRSSTTLMERINEQEGYCRRGRRAHRRARGRVRCRSPTRCPTR